MNAFEMAGSFVANFVNGIVTTLQTILDETPWEDLADGLVSGINKMVDEFDEEAAGKLIHDALQKAFDVAKRLLSETDFDAIGEKIGKFLSEIDLLSFTDDVAQVLWGLLKAAVSVAIGIAKENPLATALLASAFAISTVADVGLSIGKVLATKMLEEWAKQLVVNGGLEAGFATLGTTAASAASSCGVALGGIVAVALAGYAGWKVGELIADSQWWNDIVDKVTGNESFDAMTNSGQTTAQYYTNAFKDRLGQEFASGQDLLPADLYNEMVRVFGDQFTEIGVTYQQMADAISNGNIELTTSTLTAIQSYLKDAKGMTSMEVSEITYGFLDAAGRITDGMKTVDNSINSTAGSVQHLQRSELGLVDASGKLVLTNDQLNKVQGQAVMSADAAFAAYERQFGAVNNLTQSSTNAFNANRNLIGSMDSIPRSFEEYTESAKKAGDKVGENIDLTEQFQDLWTNYQIQQIDISELEKINDALNSINDNSGVVTDIKTGIQEISDLLSETLTIASEGITTFLDTTRTSITEFFTGTLTLRFQELDTKLTGVETKMKTVVDNSRAKIQEMLDWFDKTIVPRFSKEYWDELLANIPVSFEESFKAACNLVITEVNRLIDEINDAFDISWDSLEVDGEEIFPSGSAKVLEIAHIPKLAQGAVIPPNREFLAMLGDQRSGMNIEAPLDTIKAAFEDVVANMQVENVGNSVMELDGQTFARLITPYVVSELNREGYKVSVLEA